jgi:CRP-like cAMP-binding protein
MVSSHRAAPVLVKAQGPACGTWAPVEPVAAEDLKVTANEVNKAPEKPLVLDPSQWLTKLTAGINRHEYLADEPVFSQGDPANAVFYIQRGKVRLTVQSADGERAVVSILPAGSFLGECCLAGQTVRSATASALGRGIIVRIEKQATLDLLRRDPEFAGRFLAHLLSRSICVEADLVSHLFDSSEKRHPRTRGLEARFGAEWKSIPATAKISPESLAEKIRTTSFNVRFLLDGFRELGFIDSRGDEMLVHGSLRSIVPYDDGIC